MRSDWRRGAASQDRRLGGRRAAVAVQVLDAQQAFAARRLGGAPGEERGIGVAQVQQAAGRGGETGDDGGGLRRHGFGTTGETG
jgi:hypothetical protein